MEVFHNDDEAYARWREEHPDGYVVDVRTDEPPLLHRAKGRSTTTLPKTCATDPAELEIWARRHGRWLESCANCEP